MVVFGVKCRRGFASNFNFLWRILQEKCSADIFFSLFSSYCKGQQMSAQSAGICMSAKVLNSSGKIGNCGFDLKGLSYLSQNTLVMSEYYW